MTRRVLLPIAIFAFVAAGLASGGRASISPCGTEGSHFSGGEATGITQVGAKANITAQDPSLCDAATGSPSTSSAWSMEVSGDGTYLAQVGYIHTGSLFVYQNQSGYHYSVFTEWTPLSGPDILQFWSPSPPPSSALYEVSRNATDARINLWEGTTQLTHTSYDPALWWSTPWIPEFYGETHHCQSDIPGTTSNRVTFSNVEKKSSAGSWSQINDLLLHKVNVCSNDRYNKQWDTQPNSFDIWTYPLS